MSNHKKRKAVFLHHSQIDKGKARKADRVARRQFSFEINRKSIKARVEADREYLAAAVLVFLIGLILVVYGIVYIVGVILYG